MPALVIRWCKLFVVGWSGVIHGGIRFGLWMAFDFIILLFSASSSAGLITDSHFKIGSFRHDGFAVHLNFFCAF